MAAGPAAPDNPWNADTLEWAVSSPPPAYSFLRIPVVGSREPLWDQPELASINRADEAAAAVLTAGATREAVSSTVLDADAPETIVMPADSNLPIMLAFGLFILFIGLLGAEAFTQVFISGIGSLIVAAALFLWFWPQAGTQP